MEDDVKRYEPGSASQKGRAAHTGSASQKGRAAHTGSASQKGRAARPDGAARSHTPKTGASAGPPHNSEQRQVRKRRLRPQWVAGLAVLLVAAIVLIVLLCRSCSDQSGEDIPTNSDSDLSLSLSDTSLTLSPGATHQLALENLPEGAVVVWSSSNPSIAAVSAVGLVSGKEDGTATIAATVTGETVSCTVRVSETADTDVGTGTDGGAGSALTDIAFTDRAFSVTTGSVITLALRTTPEDFPLSDLVWASSNEDIATVKNGVVTTLTPGVATVTARHGSLAAACIITVRDQSVDVTGVTLDRNTVTLAPGSKLTLQVTIAPEDATSRSASWKSSDIAVVRVSNGVITAKAPGTASVTVTVDGKSAVCIVTVEEGYLSSGELYPGA